MKFKLIFDSSVPDKDGDCMGEAEDNGYCSDFYVNSRHEHEKGNYRDLLYRRMNKYFRCRGRSQDMQLVDVPDEIMLQYMLEGVYDMDWMAYNFRNNCIGISNTARGALRYGDEPYYGMSSGSSKFSMKVDDPHFFSFGISTDSPYEIQNSTREDYQLVPDGDHYKNIIESIEPYTTFRLSQQFATCSDVIYSTQDFGKDEPRYGIYDEIQDDVWYEDQSLDQLLSLKRVFMSDEHKSKETWDMRYEAFVMCLEFWRDDHPAFLACKKYLSDYQIEAFRLLDARIKSQFFGTNK